MAKTKISEYSSTSAGANLNTDIASINIDEGCSPANINNAIRALMAQVKDLQSGASGDTIPITAGGTGSANASSARSALSAAISGANSDITSLTGLTTPLSIAQGGTGYSTTASISTVGRVGTLVTIITVNTHGFVVGDTVTVAANTTTSINGSFSIVSVDAGTKSFTYNTVSSGTIATVSDTGTAITSSQRYVDLTSNVTNTLPMTKGGTGVTSFIKNTLLLGNGSSAIGAFQPSTNGKIVTSKAGSSVSNNSFIVGVQYTISSLGTTTNTEWNTIAGTSSVTYAIGDVFTAAVTGSGSGNGTATENVFSMESVPVEVVAGSANTVTAGSFVTNVYYTIASVGTTDFTLIGAASNTIGVTFKSTGAGTGTGTATSFQNGSLTLGGFKVIWGSANITSDSDTTITFHTAFSIAPLFVTTDFRNDYGSGTDIELTKTGFIFNRNDSLGGTTLVRYLAIGY